MEYKHDATVNIMIPGGNSAHRAHQQIPSALSLCWRQRHVASPLSVALLSVWALAAAEAAVLWSLKKTAEQLTALAQMIGQQPGLQMRVGLALAAVVLVSPAAASPCWT